MGAGSSHLKERCLNEPYVCCGDGVPNSDINKELVQEYSAKHVDNDDDQTYNKIQQKLNNMKEELNAVTQRYNQTKMDLDKSQNSEKRYNELVEQLNKYKSTEQKQKEQYTKLMDSKHELEHKINKLTEIVGGYKQIESTQFSGNNSGKSDNEVVHNQLLNENNQMLQDLMHKLAAQKVDAGLAAQQIVDIQTNHNVTTNSNIETSSRDNNTSHMNNEQDPQQITLLQEPSTRHVIKSIDQIQDENRVIATLERAQSSTSDVKDIIMKQYKTVAYELDDDVSDDSDDKEESEEDAIRKEIQHLQKESNAALRINVEEDDESHLIRSGTDRKWDRASVINQKKEMEEAMAHLVKQAITPHEHSASATPTAMQLLSALSPRNRGQKMEQEEDEYESSMDEAEKKEIERRKSEQLMAPKTQPSLYRDGTRSNWDDDHVDELREDMRKRLRSLADTLDVVDDSVGGE